jgi:hypothetical protein
MQRYRITRIKGYNGKALVIDRHFKNLVVELIKEKEEELYNHYKRLGVKVQYLILDYKPVEESKRGRGNKLNSKGVYDYWIANPDENIKNICYKFNICEVTFKRYISIETKKPL